MSDMPLKLPREKRRPFSTAPLVADRILDLHFVRDCPIVQRDCDGAAGGLLGWIVVVDTVLLVLDASDHRPAPVPGVCRCEGPQRKRQYNSVNNQLTLLDGAKGERLTMTRS